MITTKSAPTWLDKVHSAQDELRREANRLDSLARAFYRTGNAGLGNELSDAAISIRKSSETIGTAIGGNLVDQVEQSQNFLGSAMSAALTVLATEKRDV